MGLREAIQTDLGAAFDGDLADAVTALTVIHRADQLYDPAAGVIPGTETRYLTRGAVEEYSALDVGNSGGAITESDSQITILQNEVDVKITTEMYIDVGDGEEMRIIKSRADPAEATYSVQVRHS